MTHHLVEQKQFYTRTLGLLLLSETNDSITMGAGTSRLVFLHANPDTKPFYHFAFNIPENKFAQAKAWLLERCCLLEKNGIDEFHFAYKNAHALYFLDVAGNILEFIARHDLPNASTEPFGTAALLYISEIGLVVDNVPTAVDFLRTSLGMEVYRAESDTFTTVGDEYGLFIVVKRGRQWFPRYLGAEVHPLAMTLQGAISAQYAVPRFPYWVEVAQ